MNVGTDDFRRHFELLSDDALLETNRDDLVTVAQVCYDEEILRRGLDSGVTEGDVAAEPSATGDVDELVMIATYLSGDEANLARGLLQSAEIPCRLDTPRVALGGFEIHLSVPASLAENALAVLGDEISDDELAAQAEAAGPHPEDEDKAEDEDTLAE
jgi:hypothetical protein